MSVVIAVAGSKNSGKTTLLAGLLPLLRARGLAVAVVKHDGHRFEPDREGTDSRRMLEAGALGAAVYDGEKYQLVRYAAVTERELIAQFPEADLVLLEGGKRSPWPKLEVWRPELGLAPVCDPETLLAMVTEGEPPAGVPRFRPDELNPLANMLVTFVEEQKGTEKR